MKIAICDDDFTFRKLIKQQINAYMQQQAIEVEFQTYGSAVHLLGADIHDMDILFLDVDLVTHNGIDIAKQLRLINPNFVLIFVSGLLEFAPHGYSVNAFRYLLKSELNTHLADCLMDTLHELGYNAHMVTLPFVGGAYTISSNELVYVASSAHKLTFHLAKAILPERTLYQKLDDIEPLFPADEFIRPHKSYLVGLRYVVDIHGRTVLLQNGLELPVSNANASSVRKKLFRYKGLIR